ncbi:MAG: hypothetical protein JW969_10510 [Spirochaetales bacterium]|nr:hypothetical protein [Spirochaetales bacterium]
MVKSKENRYVFLSQYNQRANTEMYEVLSVLTDKARKRDSGSWFGSIHGTLNHLIITDINWLKRYRALNSDSKILKDPILDSPNLSWEHDLQENFDPLWMDRKKVDILICDWFSDYPESRYNDAFEYFDSRGTARQAVARDAFDFLFVHQTHHRGQVSQILDECGIKNNFADNVNFLEYRVG